MRTRWILIPTVMTAMALSTAMAGDMRVYWQGGSMVIRNIPGISDTKFPGEEFHPALGLPPAFGLPPVVVEFEPLLLEQPQPLQPVQPLPQVEPQPPVELQPQLEPQQPLQPQEPLQPQQPLQPQPELQPVPLQPQLQPQVAPRIAVIPQVPVTKRTNIIRNSANGVGNRIVIDNGPSNGQGGVTIVDNVRNGYGNKVIVNNPGETVIIGGKCYPKAKFSWTNTQYRNDMRCWLYWSPRDRSWFRYNAATEHFQCVPLDFDDDE